MARINRWMIAVFQTAAIFAATSRAIAVDYNAQEYIDQVGPKRAAFRTCIEHEAVRLGESNSESADSILRAVTATCKHSEDELRALYARTPFSTAYVEDLIASLRKTGEDAGIAALLQRRREMRPPK